MTNPKAPSWTEHRIFGDAPEIVARCVETCLSLVAPSTLTLITYFPQDEISLP